MCVSICRCVSFFRIVGDLVEQNRSRDARDEGEEKVVWFDPLTLFIPSFFLFSFYFPLLFAAILLGTVTYTIDTTGCVHIVRIRGLDEFPFLFLFFFCLPILVAVFVAGIILPEWLTEWTAPSLSNPSTSP